MCYEWPPSGTPTDVRKDYITNNGGHCEMGEICEKEKTDAVIRHEDRPAVDGIVGGEKNAVDVALGNITQLLHTMEFAVRFFGWLYPALAFWLWINSPNE